MGMGINHVWSTGSHASGTEQARPEEARSRAGYRNRSRSSISKQ